MSGAITMEAGYQAKITATHSMLGRSLIYVGVCGLFLLGAATVLMAQGSPCYNAEVAEEGEVAR